MTALRDKRDLSNIEYNDSFVIIIKTKEVFLRQKKGLFYKDLWH